MSKTKAYATTSPRSPLGPFEIERREPREHDIVIEIAYCGVCHSDIHQARDEWGGSIFPMVPGHEIAGKVTKVGARVEKFKEGDLAGVGCMVDSCRTCEPCRRDLEQFCERGAAMTYNGTEMDRKTPTYGGYSQRVVVDERFALKIQPGQDLSGVAPLLCAGITTYSPLRHWKTKPGSRVGVVGLGGLGHMAVKLAAAMGAEVTMLSTSKRKEADARRLGAHEFGLTSDQATFKKLGNRFDLIIDTISAPHDYNAYLGMVKVDGTMVLLGVPPQPAPVHAFSLIGGRKSISGSLIGGIAETQEMLDFCAQHRLVADVEVIPIQQINEAYERMMKGDVRYRFSIDAKTLA
ncbi:NAD(P)-dependent alcohol dehydrogenase [Anaeromyxobacter diazotrophicus]|uniref:NADP-dependent alcohol dehydrogenase n=1 Tax=Anaeromyxobacter diazotrophicus TaxID=2590199 RepID=A0A7I9VPN0_9BACT|nr:NAD(P)-dependent alcohol dehydrogenase [Anaeromyxobacter diazotrophicus]GEJ58099.1 NADP-dependent alcohol dehydrogenase [Anaeromyxobacter diazotrophicus]